MIDPAIIASVITALITGGFTLAGVLAANNAQRKVSEAKQDARMEALEDKMDTYHREDQEAIGRLEKKQDKYNNLQERTFENEKKIAILEAKKGAAS